MSRPAWQTRVAIIQAIRRFFETEKFQEIVTPVLQSALPLEPNVHAFSTDWQTQASHRKLYLSTSPESSLKKMMGQGSSNCFAISHCFRNLEGSGAQHQPEFLMLEWYRGPASMSEIMSEVQALILDVKKSLDRNQGRDHSDQLVFQRQTINLANQWPSLSLVALFQKYAHLNLLDTMTDPEMITQAQKKGYQTQNATWEELFNQIFLNEIEPHLPMTPFFLTDFPARTSPLCQTQTARPNLANRFELYIAQMELGNGNQENLDRASVARSFKQETHYRLAKKTIVPPIDTQFLDSLEKLQLESRKVAGMGLGIDRLAMLMADTTNISDVQFLTV